MIASIDVGFGWTKVVTDDGGSLKFPSWIGYGGSAGIPYGTKRYLVGENVQDELCPICIPDVNDLLKYFPLFIKHAESILGGFQKIVTGLHISDKKHLGDLRKIVEGLGIDCDILSGGLGVFSDVQKRLPAYAEEVLIIDVGFNSVEYIIADKTEGTWRLLRGNSIQGLGVKNAIEVFRASFPDEISKAKSFSLSRLIKVFENGFISIENKKVDLTSAKKNALESYEEVFRTRMECELGDLIYYLLVFTGGGANVLTPDIFKRKKSAVVIEEPEFSKARGYLRYCIEGKAE